MDKWYKTNDTEAFPLARRLIREEGLLCGGSSGTALAVALKAAKDLKKGQKCVVVLPDGIRNYMTKFVSDNWMEARHFKKLENEHNHWWWNHCVAELNVLESAVKVLPSTIGRVAVKLLKDNHLEQVPVLDSNGYRILIYYFIVQI